jgi:HlyD family secretion protein
MKRFIVFLAVLVAIGVGAGAYYMRRNGPEPQVSTAQLSRGDIVDAVAATGTLEAVETVDVGTQVSGVVKELHADFNSIVRKGQIIARLDPSLIQTQVEQNRANVVRADAELDRLRVGLQDAQQKHERAKQMWAKNLIPRTELETAEVNVKSAEAQIRSSQAALVQARANLNQQEVNLQHTVIEAPIDGIVIARNVDVGQTVAASMQAPTLYVLAADLTKMQVLANIDEADVGRMRPGQAVTFRVDAYPTDTFTGTVQQVRLQPAVVQNVVTYSTVIAVPNLELKLKPGMTANVNIEIARRTDVLRVPNAALRFRPTTDTFAALNQPVPPEFERMMAGRGGSGRGQAGGPGGGGQAGPGQTAAGQPGASGSAPQTGPAPQGTRGAAGGGAQARSGEGQQRPREGSAEARGGGDRPAGEPAGGDGRAPGSRGGFDPNVTPEERRKRFEERMAGLPPEERERIMARMRESGRGPFGAGAGNGGGNNGAAAGDPRGGQGGRSQASTAQNSPLASRGNTIDSLFGPLPTVESRGLAWLWMNKQLKLARLRLGVSDGTYTEVLNEEELQPGMEVVLNVTTGLEPQARPGQGGANNPLMGPQRGFPGGGRGQGGTGGGGRGR